MTWKDYWVDCASSGASDTTRRLAHTKEISKISFPILIIWW